MGSNILKIQNTLHVTELDWPKLFSGNHDKGGRSHAFLLDIASAIMFRFW